MQTNRSSMTLLKIKNLSVKYGRKLALQNIELELKSNEIDKLYNFLKNIFKSKNLNFLNEINF